MAVGADPAGSSEKLCLTDGLTQAQLAENGGWVGDSERDSIAKPLMQSRQFTQHRRHASVEMASPREVEVGVSDQTISQNRLQFVDWIGLVRAEALLCSLDTGPISVPRLHFTIPWSYEERESVGFDYGDCVGFRKAGEEEESRILSKLVVDVVITSRLGPGGDHRNRRANLFEELAASVGMEIRVADHVGRLPACARRHFC